MAQVLDFAKVTVSAPSQVGDGGNRLDGLVPQAVPFLPNPQLRAWSYTVPANGKFTLQGLACSLYHGNTRAAGAAAGVTANGAVWKIRQGSTDKLEGRLHIFCVQGNPPGGDELVVYGYNCNRRVDLGDGVVFTSADTINVTVTPASATAGAMYLATIFGTRAGAPDIRKGILVAAATTADQAIISYTPASDYTLLGFTIEAVQVGAMVLNGGTLRLNGAVIWEFGPAYYEETQCQWTGGKDASSSNQMGVVALPVEGLELQQNDLLELYVHAIANMSHVVCVQLVGETTSYGGSTGAVLHNLRAGASRIPVY